MMNALSQLKPAAGPWVPDPIWLDGTVFIIGGGPSLKGFDWTPFFSKNVVTINDGFRLGTFSDFNLFGDVAWYNRNKGKEDFLEYHGTMVGCTPDGLPHDDNIKQMKHESFGVWLDGRLGNNSGTGAMAINFALYLGATRIVLVGFDHKLGPNGENNWYPNPHVKARPSLYTTRFQNGFNILAERLEKHYPMVEVLNAGPDSALETFPRVSLERILKDV